MTGHWTDQPRDKFGRWTSSGSGYVASHEKQILTAASVASALLLTRGKFIAKGVQTVAPHAAKTITRAATVRKVGPVKTSGLRKTVSQRHRSKVPDSVEGWQYHKGFFSPTLGDKIGPVGRPVRDLRLGAELKWANRSRTIGAPKPLNYDYMNFTNSPGYTMAGKAIGVGAPVVVGGALLLNKKDN